MRVSAKGRKLLPFRESNLFVQETYRNMYGTVTAIRDAMYVVPSARDVWIWPWADNPQVYNLACNILFRVLCVQGLVRNERGRIMVSSEERSPSEHKLW